MDGWTYKVRGGSHDGSTLGFPEQIKPGATLPIQMRDLARPGELTPDPKGRSELYTLEPDGVLYFLNVHLKDGKQITPPGTFEPSRIINGTKHYDYRFIGGSHDGNNMSLPHAFEEGFTMALNMRGEHGPLPGGKKEVYKFGADRRFRYQNAVMKDGQQITPPRRPPESTE